MNHEDLQILSYIRNNCRSSITDISRKMGLPILEMMERLKIYEKNYIKNYTCVLDFQKVGFKFDIYVLLKVQEKTKKRFEKFITNNKYVNSFFYLEEEKYLVEVLFKNEIGFDKFLEIIKADFEISGVEILKINHEFKRESFLEL